MFEEKRGKHWLDDGYYQEVACSAALYSHVDSLKDTQPFLAYTQAGKAPHWQETNQIHTFELRDRSSNFSFSLGVMDLHFSPAACATAETRFCSGYFSYSNSDRFNAFTQGQYLPCFTEFSQEEHVGRLGSPWCIERLFCSLSRHMFRHRGRP